MVMTSNQPCENHSLYQISVAAVQLAANQLAEPAAFASSGL